MLFVLFLYHYHSNNIIITTRKSMGFIVRLGLGSNSASSTVEHYYVPREAT